jgi:hypothetical protein
MNPNIPQAPHPAYALIAMDGATSNPAVIAALHDADPFLAAYLADQLRREPGL